MKNHHFSWLNHAWQPNDIRAFYKLQLRKGQLSKIQGFWADLSKDRGDVSKKSMVNSG